MKCVTESDVETRANFTQFTAEPGHFWFRSRSGVTRPKKKVVLFPEIGQMKNFSSLTRPHSRMCIRINIFCFKQKKTQIKKQKKLKKIEKQKKPKKKRRKGMLLLLTISVENLLEHDDIVWQFVLCTFNLHDKSIKRERVLKSNKLWKKLYLFVRFLFKMKTKKC